MAAAALFLASDDAGYVSGSNLFVDGAWETTGYPDLARFRAQLGAPR
jgi:meso-butanediol dehydrogenase/(S,S)-butanediol dehydrogenase/diacetyl reductase